MAEVCFGHWYCTVGINETAPDWKGVSETEESRRKNVRWIKHLLAGLFVGFNLLDMMTTMFIVKTYPEIKVFETNPITNLFGMPFWVLFVFKIIIMLGVLWVFYTPFKTERSYFMWLTFVLFLTIVLAMVSYNNYNIYNNPEKIEERIEYVENVGVEYVQQQNARTYNSLVGLTIFLPFLIAFIPYLIFEWTMPYEKFKKRRLIEK